MYRGGRKSLSSPKIKRDNASQNLHGSPLWWCSICQFSSDFTLTSWSIYKHQHSIALISLKANESMWARKNGNGKQLLWCSVKRLQEKTALWLHRCPHTESFHKCMLYHDWIYHRIIFTKITYVKWYNFKFKVIAL